MATVASGPATGRLAKTYLNTGTNATPVFAEAKFIKDLKLPLSKGEVSLEDRDSKWKKMLAGLSEVGLSGTYNKRRNKTDAIWTALMDSYLNDTPLQFYIMDAPIADSGAYGFKAYFQVFSLEKTEELETVQNYSFGMKLTYYEEAGAVVEPDEHNVA
jgi:hypothetical protein